MTSKESRRKTKEFKWFFILLALIFLCLMIGNHIWDFRESRNLAVRQSETELARNAEFIKYITLELIDRAEEGGAAIDEFVQKLTNKLGIGIRIVHSYSIDLEYNFEQSQQAINDLERDALLDGKEKRWQTDDFMYVAVPVKAKKECGVCHHLPKDSEKPVSAGYILGLIETKLSTRALRKTESDLLVQTIIGLILTIIMVGAFTFAIYRLVVNLRALQRKSEAVLNTVGEGIVVFDEQFSITAVNAELKLVFGFSEEDLLGKKVSTLLPGADRADFEKSMTFSIDGFSEIIGTRMEKKGVRKNGAVFPVELRIETVSGDAMAGRLYTAAIRDISERKHLEAELRLLTITDKLTGLYNKHHFEEKTLDEVARASRQNTPLSLLFADIDKFKDFNDTYGHVEGDGCLKKVGRVIEDQLRDRVDIGFRYGGEEFVVILPGTDLAQACIVADRIRLSFSELVFFPQISGRQVEVKKTISIGVAELEKAESATSLVTRADKAMYSAKAAGGNTVRKG